MRRFVSFVALARLRYREDLNRQGPPLELPVMRRVQLDTVAIRSRVTNLALVGAPGREEVERSVYFMFAVRMPIGPSNSGFREYILQMGNGNCWEVLTDGFVYYAFWTPNGYEDINLSRLRAARYAKKTAHVRVYNAEELARRESSVWDEFLRIFSI
jgi:hypothetical protein